MDSISVDSKNAIDSLVDQVITPLLNNSDPKIVDRKIGSVYGRIDRVVLNPVRTNSFDLLLNFAIIATYRDIFHFTREQ